MEGGASGGLVSIGSIFFFAFSPSQESLGTRSGVGRLVGGAAVDFSLAGEEPPLFTCEFLPLEPSPSWPQ